MHWKITPHKDPEFDCCLLPANSNDDHRRALEYAQEVLEMIWDNIIEDDPNTVTIELCSETNDDDERVIYE